MGCKSSAPLKEETPVATTIAPQVVAVEVAAAKVETPLVFTKIVDEETLVKPKAFTTVVASEPAVIAVPAIAAAPKPEEAKKRRVRRKKTVAPQATAAAPVLNDENAPVAVAQKTFAPITAIKTFGAQKEENAAPKRVAFAAKKMNSNVAPSEKFAPKVVVIKHNRKHKNVEQKKVEEMTMAFQRLLTHADHLDAHLSTRNTYTNKA